MGNAFGSPAAVAFCRRIVGKRSRDSAPSTSQSKRSRAFILIAPPLHV
jgi:hypothetical protein